MYNKNKSEVIHIYSIDLLSIKQNDYEFIILWHVDPLLSDDREIGDCTVAHKQQRNGVFFAVR
jgi:hypothetical protein